MTRQPSDTAEGYNPTTWTTNALPPIQLSTDQCESLRVLATKLLSNTLRDYDIYSADPRKRRMSRRRWKPVKKKDHITVYKERYPTPSPQVSIMQRVSMAFQGNEWIEPKLLVTTGWIDGTVGDVMYGVASADAQNMLLKATVVQNELINGAVLACIDAPCAADPFRFLGIKWFVKSPPTGFQGIMRPKDMVVLEATGITTRPNGECIGYHLLHSVDLPQYRDTTFRSGVEVTRGHISSCSIFREIPTGLGSRHSKVDVYVKGYVEAHGNILSLVALKAASSGFISSWNTVECANLKKLMWCFRQLLGRPIPLLSRQHSPVTSSISCSSRNPDYVGTSSACRFPYWPQNISLDSSSSCGTCTKRLGKLVNGAFACVLCSRTTCSRCRVPRTLKEVNSELWLRQVNVVICKRCVLQVDNLAAVDVARAEVQAGWYSTTNAVQSFHKCLTSFVNTGPATDTGASHMTLPVLISPTADQPDDSFQGVERVGTAQARILKPDDVARSDREHRQQIWSQTVELSMVAESIYNLTPENTDSLNVPSFNR